MLTDPNVLTGAPSVSPIAAGTYSVDLSSGTWQSVGKDGLQVETGGSAGSPASTQVDVLSKTEAASYATTGWCCAWREPMGLAPPGR